MSSIASLRLRLGITALFIAEALGCLSWTNFQPWDGPDEFEGSGGSFYTKDGVDVYTAGTPPRRFRVLGVIDSSVFSSSAAVTLGGSSWAISQMLREAKKRGGDAIVFITSDQGIVGYSSSQGTGSTQSLGRYRVVLVEYLGDGAETTPPQAPMRLEASGLSSSQRFMARIYNLETGESSSAEFEFSGSGKGGLTAEISGAGCKGEYLTMMTSSPGWGSIFRLLYNGESEQEGSNLARAGLLAGQAMCSTPTGGTDAPKSPVRFVECEYVTSRSELRGYGACRDNMGTIYKLLF